MTAVTDKTVPFGVAPFDERVGGLEPGGTYLLVGAPGPGKMVAALQFLHAGVSNGERGLLVTNSDPDGILGVARAWGVPMDDAWERGTLQIIGFRDDFELRAMRTIAPEEVLEELSSVIGGVPDRVAVDPGAMFLTGGAKTVLGAAFIAWARKYPSTVVATLSVDSDAGTLPSSADWLLNAATALLTFGRRPDGLYQLSLGRTLPGEDGQGGVVTLQLKPGTGLIKPESFPTRRDRDRSDVDRSRLLLVSLGHSHASDLEAWASRAFSTDITTAPFDAVTKVQSGAVYGCVLVHSGRSQIREAVQACRALRPLTRGAIVFASDDAVRATDRIQLLEAGADDCLTGGLDFRELGLRIKQSMAAGAKPAIEGAERTVIPAALEASEGGRATVDALTSEVKRRAADASLAFFCMLDVTSKKLSSEDLCTAVGAFIRAEEGDLVAASKDRCLVLLHGARPGQLGAFLDRLRAKLNERSGGDAGLEITVLSHPADAVKIEALLKAAGATKA